MRYLKEDTKPTFWEQVGKAFTDPNSAFNVPVKIPVELDKQTRHTIIYSASILAGGMILASLLLKRK